MSKITSDMIAELYIENHNLRAKANQVANFVGQVIEALQIELGDDAITYDEIINQLVRKLSGAQPGVQEKV